MTALLLVLALAQPSPCAALLANATDRADSFDPGGAIALLAAAPAECVGAGAARWYLEGLAAAREAYAHGGSAESLEPVRRAIAELQSRAEMSPSAEISRLVLLAAAAAAQSEREELALLIDHARQVERTASVGSRRARPIVSAHEVAGDLWLQVHRFEDARDAYLLAAAEVGRSQRVVLGLARVSQRLGDEAAACAAYGELAGGWRRTGVEPPELVEARTFLQRASCERREGAAFRP